MEDNVEKKINLQVKPKFNLLYELGMPTGRKIRNAFFVGIVFLIASILIIKNQSVLEAENSLFLDMPIISILKITSIIIIAIAFIYALICIVIQNLTYKHITYTFYDDYMVYEDDFLNQHKKTIQYENIKEVEIRRTVLDRIFGFGIIVIYTSAENSKRNGMVIYGVKNVREAYDKIEEIVHKSSDEVENKETIKDDPNDFIENMTKQVK